MFNSELIDQYGPDLMDAVWEKQKDIVDVSYDLWLDLENNDEKESEAYLRWFFPPGFITRDKERAMRIMQDVYDIVQSSVIRQNIRE